MPLLTSPLFTLVQTQQLTASLRDTAIFALLLSPNMRAIDIDPRGDLFIICGNRDAGTRLLVSSRVLSLASSKFEEQIVRLQQEHFRDGATSSGSLASPLELEIPNYHDEETTRAVQMLLNAMHWSADSRISVYNRPENFRDGLRKIRALTKLADWYICTNVIYHLAESWIIALASSTEDVWHVIDLLEPAFRIRHRPLFADLTERLVMAEKLHLGRILHAEWFIRLVEGSRRRRTETRQRVLEAMLGSLFKLNELSEYAGQLFRGDEEKSTCNAATRLGIQVRVLEDTEQVAKRLHAHDCGGDNAWTYSDALKEAISRNAHHCNGGDFCPLLVVQNEMNEVPAFHTRNRRGISMQDFLDERSGQWRGTGAFQS